MLFFRCPRCQGVLQAPEAKGGAKAHCPKCRQRLQIPLPPPGKTLLAPLVSAPPPPAKSAGTAGPPRAARTARGPLLLAATVGALVALLVASLVGAFGLFPRDEPPAAAEAKANPPAGPSKGPADKVAAPSEPTAKGPETPAAKPQDEEKAVPEKAPAKPDPAPPKEDAGPPLVEKPEAPPAKEPAQTPLQPSGNPAGPANPGADIELPPPVSIKPKPPPEKPKSPPEKKGDPVAARADPVVMPTRLRTLDEIRKTLAGLSAPAERGMGSEAAEREVALRRLKAYRYLAGVPHDNLVPDDELNRLTAAAARLCYKVGRIDHDPPNPGLPKDEYELGRKGARGSNLAGSPRARMSLRDAVDAFVEDSDPFNIGRLGHRRWCLSPRMRKVGFGRAGGCCAMWALDQSQPEVPASDFLAYPAPGPMPLEFFGREHAWSISLNPEKYARPSGPPQVSVYPAGPDGEKSGPALPLRDVALSTEPMGGTPTCIIFRPEKGAVAAGKRYLVEVKGVRRSEGGGPVTVRYPVEFVRLGTALEKVAETPQPDPDTVPAGKKSYASLRNLTDDTLRFTPGAGGQPMTLKAGRTLHALASLPKAGLTFSLAAPDPAGKPIRIQLRNGDHYVIRAEGKRYVVQKVPARPAEKKPAGPDARGPRASPPPDLPRLGFARQPAREDPPLRREGAAAQ